MKKNGYHEIYAAMRTMIENGEYAPGDKLPPERLLQEMWGVERTTIRRALALLAEENLIYKRAGFGSIVLEQAADAAPQTPSDPSMEEDSPEPEIQAAEETAERPVLAMVVALSGAVRAQSTLDHKFITPVYNAFADISWQNGYQTFSTVTPSASCDESIFSMLQNCAGVIWADNVHPEMLRQAKERNIPSVLMSQRMSGFRSILANNADGMCIAVEHLIALGHRNIVYLGGDTVFYNGIARRDAFRTAMVSHGLNAPDRRIILSGWDEKFAAAAVERLLREDPAVTAICAANDKVAAAAITVAQNHGLRVPDDLSVIGFGNADFSGMLPVPLTTVSIDLHQFGSELFYALQREILAPWQSPATVLMDASLIVRASTTKNY